MMEFNSSCVMLMTSLWTGIDFYAVFDEEDLKDTGIEYDSHITALYSGDLVIPKNEALENIKNSMGDYWEDLENMFKENEKLKVSDHFEISKFENDSDYLIFKVREDSDIYRLMSLMNRGLSRAYGINSEFTYTPHMTIAELEVGKASKYVFSPLLSKIYENAVFSLDDLVISYGQKDKPGEYKKYNLTSFNAVSRYFRQKELERDRQYYASLTE